MKRESGGTEQSVGSPRFCRRGLSLYACVPVAVPGPFNPPRSGSGQMGTLPGSPLLHTPERDAGGLPSNLYIRHPLERL